MKPYHRNLLLVSLLAVLTYGIYFTVSRERTLRNGRLALLELAPTDPRSLLQGDYMVLRYAFTQQFRLSELPPTGFLLLQLDPQGRLLRARPQVEALLENAQEVPLRYRIRRSGPGGAERMLLGAESFFFEEGRADTLQRARYGGLRLDGRGGSVLEGLYDADLRRID